MAFKRINPTSKSDHEAVVLVSPRGQEFKLRRKGGPPFGDEVLRAQAVGKRLRGVGVVSAGQFIVDRL